MKYTLLTIVWLFLFLSCTHEKLTSLTEYVDPMIGTDTHGHTFPGATTPFGMVQLSPSNDFKNWDWCSGYHYSDTIIKGFAHNHLSGAGLSGLGDILLMPTMGKRTTVAGSDELVDESYRSRFSHESEVARAGYYAVTLEDYNIDVELTATKRSGFHRYTFNTSGEADIVIDPTHALLEKASETSIEMVSNSEIRGYKRVGNAPKFRHMYFSAKFSKPFKNLSITNDDIPIEESVLTALKAKAIASFDVVEKEQIEVVVTLSTTGYEGVKKNYQSEELEKDFDKALKEASTRWESVLNKITLSDNTSIEKKRTFYTAMYHAFISPNIMSDVDGGYVVEGVQYESDIPQYSNYSTWDTYRAQFPLFSIIEQETTSKIVNSMISRDIQAGIGQPVWELIGYDNACMIGYTTSAVIGEAVLKNIKGIDETNAFSSIYNAAFDLTKHSAVYDVSGLSDYINYGYVTAETGSSVSKTTEYNYHDYVIAKVAQKIGREKEAKEFYERSKGYRGLFNKEDGYLYPVYSNGTRRDLDLSTWDNLIPNYVSGNIWAYSSYTPHDMAGIIQMHGGREHYGKWLDKVFSDTTSIGGAQHVDISGFIGKYGHGDEPGHQMPYLYNFVGQPWKGQKHINEVVSEMYTDQPDGLINNEDLGQMSAWYIFSTLGFYPVSPADLNYQLGAPFHDSATINLENGRSFTVHAVSLSKENIYVQSVKLNGKDYKRTYIEHDQIMSGGILEFTMGDNPNTSWGHEEENSSIGSLKTGDVHVKRKASSSPYDMNEAYFFYDKHTATLNSNDAGAAIYYTTDGSIPSEKSRKYEHPFSISNNCTLRAIAIQPGLSPSKVYEKPLFKSVFPNLKVGYPKITMNNWSSPNYGNEDGSMLFDEITGSSSYGDAKWTGLKGPLNIDVDLGQDQIMENVSVGILSDIGSWIFPAQSIHIYGGVSQAKMELIGELIFDKKGDYPKEVNRHSLKLIKGKYRYLKLEIQPYGKAPEWHGASGHKVWLFADEIIFF